MQSALDIFCYVLVLIYGLALSADISTGGHVSYFLTLLTNHTDSLSPSIP